MFCSADMEVLPADGQSIMALDELRISAEDGLVSISCEAEGELAQAKVYLQSGEGEFE